MQAVDCLDDLADSEDGIKVPLVSSVNMSLWSSIALQGCSFLRKLFSVITNIRIQSPMGIFKEIFQFLRCCFLPDPAIELLDNATTAQNNYNSYNDAEKKSDEAQNELKLAIKSYTFLKKLAEKNKAKNVELREILTNLANLTWELYQYAAGQPSAALLQEVIALNQEALKLPQGGPKNSSVMAILSMNSATAFRELFVAHNGDDTNIQKSIQFFKNALEYLDAGSKDRIEITVDIGVTYCIWHGRLTSHQAWMEAVGADAVQAIKEAYSASTQDAQFLPALTTCAHTLSAIYSDQCRDALPSEHPSSPTQLSSAPPPSLNDAITFCSLALETMLEEDSRYAGELRVLAEWLFYRYDRYSNAEKDLSQSKDAASRALRYRDALTQDAVESLNFIINFNPKSTSRRDSRRERNTLRSSTIGHSRANSVDTAEEHRPSPMSARDMTEEPLELGDEDAA